MNLFRFFIACWVSFSSLCLSKNFFHFFKVIQYVGIKLLRVFPYKHLYISKVASHAPSYTSDFIKLILFFSWSILLCMDSSNHVVSLHLSEMMPVLSLVRQVWFQWILCFCLSENVLTSPLFLSVYWFLERERGRRRGREGEGERETEINLPFHLFMHSLVDSCLCPDQGPNPQTWWIGMML